MQLYIACWSPLLSLLLLCCSFFFPSFIPPCYQASTYFSLATSHFLHLVCTFLSLVTPVFFFNHPFLFDPTSLLVSLILSHWLSSFSFTHFLCLSVCLSLSLSFAHILFFSYSLQPPWELSHSPLWFWPFALAWKKLIFWFPAQQQLSFKLTSQAARQRYSQTDRQTGRKTGRDGPLRCS